MCLILFSTVTHPVYKLVIAANRDEFFNRKTAACDFWKDHPEILGGRDMEAHGTWMAMSRSGKIAMITNYRDPAHINPKAPSRGKLVSDFLLSQESSKKYLERIQPDASHYNGFNLIVGELDDLFYFSNYLEGIHHINSGIHGLSNRLLETPWPKVTRGKEKLAALIHASREINPDDLFEILYDEKLAPVDQLPDTGIEKERELALSSMFIKTGGYGTRCSTVVLVSHDDQVTYAERIYDLSTYQFTTKTFQLRV